MTVHCSLITELVYVLPLLLFGKTVGAKHLSPVSHCGRMFIGSADFQFAPTKAIKSVTSVTFQPYIVNECKIIKVKTMEKLSDVSDFNQT